MPKYKAVIREGYMSDITFRISPNIILGSHTSTRLGSFVKEWGSKYMLIVDPILKEYNISEKLNNLLKPNNISFFTFDTMTTAPDTQVIEQALQVARAAHVHGIISIGGSKSSNVGRVVAALYEEKENLFNFLDGKVSYAKPLPFISIPTTLRDLFLFSERCPVIDARTRQVKLVKLPANLCKLALFDPTMSASLTNNQMAIILLQSLCVAIESYTSVKSNIFSDTLLEKSFELIAKSLVNETNLKSHLEENIVQSGCLVSLAAGISSLGEASSIALAINARYKISRGLISAILLPYLIEDIAKYKSDKLAVVARRMDFAAETANDEKAIECLAENIRAKLALFKLPTRLKDLNITMEQLALAVDDAGQLEFIKDLPQSTTTEDLFDLVKMAY